MTMKNNYFFYFSAVPWESDLLSFEIPTENNEIIPNDFLNSNGINSAVDIASIQQMEFKYKNITSQFPEFFSDETENLYSRLEDIIDNSNEQKLLKRIQQTINIGKSDLTEDTPNLYTVNPIAKDESKNEDEKEEQSKKRKKGEKVPNAVPKPRGKPKAKPKPSINDSEETNTPAKRKKKEKQPDYVTFGKSIQTESPAPKKPKIKIKNEIKQKRKRKN